MTLQFMGMDDPFDSSHRKLDRAVEHFSKLQGKVANFINSEPYHEVVEPHPDKADHEIHKIKPTRELRGELDDIGDCFGEFTGNLRAALDNAGYTIAVATGKADSNNCAFPFAESLKHLISGMGKCKDLPKEIQSLFCGFQPYLGGDDLLWAINKACNTDKHRTCAPMFNIFARNGVSVGGTRFFQMPLKHTWDSAKNEMILFTLGPGPEKKFDYNFQFTVFIACDKIKTIEGEPILGIADRMGRKVESILMAIEAESRRLGFTM